MSIQEHLNKIRNAIYGKEVRESIAKGIETAYDDASEKDNANMEVKIARGTHPNLRSRLDETTAQLQQKADQSFVDSQFATIVSGAPKGTYTDLASLQSAYPSGAEGVFLVLENGHWYYWNSTTNAWTDGGVYQSAGGDWMEAMTEENEEWVI